MRSESVRLLSFHIPDCYWLDKFAMLSASFLTSLDSRADSRKLSQTDLVSDRDPERGRGENTKNVSLIRYQSHWGYLRGSDWSTRPNTVLWLADRDHTLICIGSQYRQSVIRTDHHPGCHISELVPEWVLHCFQYLYQKPSLSKVSDVIFNLYLPGNSIIQNMSENMESYWQNTHSTV